MQVLRDPVSAASHFIGCFAAIFATLFLNRLSRGNLPRQLAATVFGVSMILLYGFSGLFHGLQLPRSELTIYQKLDQSAVYLLIAGTYTPIMVVLLQGGLRKWLLGLMWAMAALGISALWLLPKLPHVASVGIYLGMGWLGLLGFWHYAWATGWRGMSWAMGGAGFYTCGAICEITQWPVVWPEWISFHEVFHLMIMGGTTCHFIYIMRFVLPYQHPDPAPTATGVHEPRSYIQPSKTTCSA